MTPQDFERFQHNSQDCGVLLYYAGEFTPAMIAAAADSLKGRLASEEAGSAAKRKVFSTFIEMAQNVLHYAAANAEPGLPQPPASGAIAVGRDANEGDAGHYWLVCSNPVHVEHIARLTEKLNALQSMSLAEIKESYRAQLRNAEHSDTDAISKGAGLGLLTIARDASAPLEYSFASTADPRSRTAQFYVKARV
jgi:hypothetical protein